MCTPLPGQLAPVLGSRGEALPRVTRHLVQRPCYQRGSPCQDPAGNRTTRRPPDHRKETQTAWYGHVSHSSSLAKFLLQSTVKGGRRRGKEKKRWEDSIREWTGLEFAKSQRAVENRKMEETGCEVFCGAPKIPAVKG